MEEYSKHKKPIHFSELKKSINKIIDSSADENIITTISQLKEDTLLVLGDPGTGKTHGIANVVNHFNMSKDHVSILIRAKSISNKATWHVILTRALGLSNAWSEGEIWQGLSALSCRNEHR